MRNYQGVCFVTATQALDGARSGDIWRVTAWAHVPHSEFPTPSRSPARLYLTDYAPGEDPGAPPAPGVYIPRPIGHQASTLSEEWVELVVIDTLALAPGDSVGVVLDAGWASGSEWPSHEATFDLVAAEWLGSVGTEPLPYPSELTLAQPSPTPSHGAVGLRFILPAPSFARVSVWDILGREVAVLADGVFPSGETSLRWERRDGPGARLPGGVYFVRLAAGGLTVTRTLIINE